jgi:nucleoside-diphosphate-sugar epimerase
MTASATPPTPPTVLVTGAGSPLAQAVTAALSGAEHAEQRAVRHAGDDLTDPAAVAPLLQDVGAIVHLAPLALPRTMPADAPAEILDRAARGTHVLLKAALDAGVRYVVLGSTLALMDAYPDDLEVTEQWRPRPRPRPTEMAPYLAELTAREFTRDVQLDDPPRITCLRFAEGIDPALAAGAVVSALDALQGGAAPERRRQRGHRWQLYHIAPLDPGARYTSALARQSLGYGQEAESAPVAPGGAR